MKRKREYTCSESVSKRMKKMGERAHNTSKVVNIAGLDRSNSEPQVITQIVLHNFVNIR